MKKIILAATVATTLAVPAVAGAHATVNAIQPQGKTLTSARQAYVVRVPSERSETSTYQVSMFVPPAVQQSIRVMKKPGWKITLAKKDTGIKGPEGDAVFAIEKITWTREQELRHRPALLRRVPRPLAEPGHGAAHVLLDLPDLRQPREEPLVEGGDRQVERRVDVRHAGLVRQLHRVVGRCVAPC